MQVPKRPRLDSSTTTTQVTPLNASPAQAGMAASNQTIINQAVATTGGQAQMPAITLSQMPIELLIHIMHSLPARDIVKLSQTARHFRNELSIELYGSSLRQRSLDLSKYSDAYDENTQTLDLDNIVNLKGITIETYTEGLGKFINMLGRHPQWANSHIKTLIFPMKMIFLWMPRHANLLSKMFSLLGGVEHLRLVGISKCPCNRAYKDGPLNAEFNIKLLQILQNFKGFKELPAKKVTIENCGVRPISNLKQTLSALLTKGFFHPALESFTFIDTDLSAPDYSIDIADGLAYPVLTTLELHYLNTPRLCLTELPETVTCLHIHTNNILQGRASSITRLEIHEASSPLLWTSTSLHNIRQTLPAIREIHFHVSDQPHEQYVMLANLAQLPLLDITFSFSSSTLHIYEVARLDKLLSTGNTVQLPHDMVFYPHTLAEVNYFRELASRKGLHALTHIQYRFYSVYAPAKSAIQTLAGLLHEGALPHLLSFSFDYEFPWNKTIPFLETVEGNSLLTNSTLPVPLRFVNWIMSHIDFEASFLLSFREGRKGITHILQQHGKRKEEITAFHENAEAKLLEECLTTKQRLTQQPFTSRELITEFERLYFQLHGIYLQQLREMGVYSSMLRVFYEEKISPFFTTPLGQRIRSNIITSLFDQYATNLLLSLEELLAEAGLDKPTVTLTGSGFSVHFVRKQPPAYPASQQKSAEMIRT
jgi:hypothetical protein